VEDYLVGDLIVTLSTNQPADPQPSRTGNCTGKYKQKVLHRLHLGSPHHKVSCMPGWGMWILLDVDKCMRQIAMN